VKILAVLSAVLLLTSCGGDEERLSFPDPLPLTAADTTFVTVAGGSFVTSWGDTVEIADFSLGRYEVSNRLYYNLVTRAGIGLPPDPEYTGLEEYLFDHPDYPAVNMSLSEAAAAASQLGGRLPTRAEWEYAAQLDLEGDFSEQYPWGILSPLDAGYPVNFLAGDEWETRGLDGYLWTAPVDSFPLTNSGFASLCGNVAEWTVFSDSAAAVCGGAWLSPEADLRIGRAKLLAPGDRARHIGFRILIPVN